MCCASLHLSKPILSETKTFILIFLKSFSFLLSFYIMKCNILYCLPLQESDLRILSYWCLISTNRTKFILILIQLAPANKTETDSLNFDLNSIWKCLEFLVNKACLVSWLFQNCSPLDVDYVSLAPSVLSAPHNSLFTADHPTPWHITLCSPMYTTHIHLSPTSPTDTKY